MYFKIVHPLLLKLSDSQGFPKTWSLTSNFEVKDTEIPTCPRFLLLLCYQCQSPGWLTSPIITFTTLSENLTSSLDLQVKVSEVQTRMRFLVDLCGRVGSVAQLQGRGGAVGLEGSATGDWPTELEIIREAQMAALSLLVVAKTYFPDVHWVILDLLHHPKTTPVGSGWSWGIGHLPMPGGSIRRWPGACRLAQWRGKAAEYANIGEVHEVAHSGKSGTGSIFMWYWLRITWRRRSW